MIMMFYINKIIPCIDEVDNGFLDTSNCTRSLQICYRSDEFLLCIAILSKFDHALLCIICLNWQPSHLWSWHCICFHRCIDSHGFGHGNCWCWGGLLILGFGITVSVLCFWFAGLLAFLNSSLPLFFVDIPIVGELMPHR